MTQVKFGPEDRRDRISHSEHLKALKGFSSAEVNGSSCDRVTELGLEATGLLERFVRGGERGDEFLQEVAQVATALRDSFRAWADRLSDSLGDHPDPTASEFFSGAVHLGGSLEMALWVLTPEKFKDRAIAADTEQGQRILEHSLEVALNLLSRPDNAEVKWWQRPPQNAAA
jgi:hypothetical protein